MQFTPQETRQYLKESEFEDLFTQVLGWDNHSQTLPVIVDETKYVLIPIAEKRGVAIFHCTATSDNLLPERKIREKIHREAAKFFHENLIIYTAPDKTTQIWQWASRGRGKAIKRRELTYNLEQSGELLIQKLRVIAFSFDEEEQTSILDVIQRLQTAFDVEKVTKKFYDRFKKEHDAFLEFLSGIPDEEMQKWYVSVMLNRLMFIYFIQKKNFLNKNDKYLQTKLTDTKRNGTDLYYKEFLCPLFFEGFAKPEDERTPEIRRLLGKIPYLNGGIFQKHEIETLHGQNIEIPDTAFEKLFAFFEQYDWHLDDRPLKNDNEINPDVLGYIFEKYINQKQMGHTIPKRTSRSTSVKIPSYPSSLMQQRNRVKSHLKVMLPFGNCCKKTLIGISTRQSKKVLNYLYQRKLLSELKMFPNALNGTHLPLRNTPYPQKFGVR